MKMIKVKLDAREYARDILSNLPYRIEIKAPEAPSKINPNDCFSMIVDLDPQGNTRLVVIYPESRSETVYYNKDAVPRILTEFIWLKRKIFNLCAD